VADSFFELRDGRRLAWCDYGVPDGTPILRIQGTPGSRFFRYPHPELWEELGVRVLMADRPGYGGSSRLPGHGLSDVADDLVELLDQEGIEKIRVVGYSGGGPHVLALCALHGDRVRAASVVVGAATIEEPDVPLLIGLNAEAYRRMSHDGWPALHELLAGQRTVLLDDPLAGFRAVMSEAPESDQAVMAEPAWQETMKASILEALRPGAEGWTDDSMAVFGAWDFELENVRTPVVWWHGRHDANAPLQAVERVTQQLPEVDLRLWENAGHLEPYHREGEILRDLLSR
jgi:pimeloyl-ACP methyl ester carboxylesterase